MISRAQRQFDSYFMRQVQGVGHERHDSVSRMRKIWFRAWLMRASRWNGCAEFAIKESGTKSIIIFPRVYPLKTFRDFLFFFEKNLGKKSLFIGGFQIFTNFCLVQSPIYDAGNIREYPVELVARDEKPSIFISESRFWWNDANGIIGHKKELSTL